MIITEQDFAIMCNCHGGHPEDFERFKKLGVWIFEDGRIIEQEKKN
tara:strand:- start:540 stop:677 length:138 start_codon:yes stop_codon:yes gene_type:complete